MSIKQISILAITFLVVIGCIIASLEMYTWQDNGEIMCIQGAVDGNMTWTTTGGLKNKNFGHVTKYKKRSQFWFSSKTDQGTPGDESIKVRFNDGGHANLSGSFSWDMPLAEANLKDLHVKYGSQEAVEQQLVRTVAEMAVYMTGPLMSSTESYATRRNDLLSLIEDQINNGIYKTESVDEKMPDPLTGAEKTVRVVKLIKGQDGNYLREGESPLKTFGIKAYNLSLNDIKYDADVEAQIKQQQQATMQVQIAIAKAKEAEQKTLTVTQEGKATAAAAEWEQKTTSAKLVTAAEQEVLVSAQKLLAAENNKKAEIAMGEGESKRRQMVMEADGALEKTLAAWVEINKTWAEAIKGYQGQWVPTVMMGGQSASQSQAGSGAMDLVNMLTAKTALDLGLDMKVITKLSPKAPTEMAPESLPPPKK